MGAPIVGLRLRITIAIALLGVGLAPVVPTSAAGHVEFTATFSIAPHGAGRLTVFPDASVTLYLNLRRLHSGNWAVALRTGTCARPGTRVEKLAALHVPIGGAAARTYPLREGVTRSRVVVLTQGATTLCATLPRNSNVRLSGLSSRLRVGAEVDSITASTSWARSPA